MRNPLVLVVLAVAFAVGCGGGGSYGGQSISVSFAMPPPASLGLGGTASISATVSYDSASKGVSWSCAPAGSCGSFNPTTTASAGMTTYTAPATAPAGGSVTITATSVSDSTKIVSAMVNLGVAISITTPPPSSMQTSATATIAATTTNDTIAAGNPAVNWTCAPVGSCGSFNPTSTASGSTGTTIYTAPAAVPATNPVTITATSMSDSTKFKTAMVTITGPPVTIIFSTPPPATIAKNGTAMIAATTTNDTANPAVTWTCTPAGICGSFNPTSTASGAATTYTAPATSGQVTITATSITDGTKTVSANVAVTGTASNTTLMGHYAFFVQAPTGNPTDRGTTTFVGSVNLDGNGNVLGGMEDLLSFGYRDVGDPILATVPASSPNTSSYAVDPSGHGKMRMVTNNGETLDISFVLTSASHGVVIEVGGVPGSGTLDMQTATGFAAAQISGGYSFTMTGQIQANKVSAGGVFTADGVSALSGGTFDANTAGVMSSSLFTGTFTPPDSNGRGQLIFSSLGRSFYYYIVSAKVLRILEGTDIQQNWIGGSAYAQGTASTTLSGNYVYQHSGWSSTGRTVAAGQFTANATTITGGVSDSNAGGSPPTAPTMAHVSGTYTNGTMNLSDAAGPSTFNVYIVDPTLNILDPNNTTGGGGVLLLHTDAAINGTGLIVPQPSPGTTFAAASYALNLQNSIAATTPDELDLVGVMTSDGSASFMAGLADYDQNNSTNPATMIGATVTGAFLKDTANAGRFTGSFTVTPPTGGYSFIPGVTPPTIFSVSYYQASASQAFVVETDTIANIVGSLIQQALP